MFLHLAPDITINLLGYQPTRAELEPVLGREFTLSDESGDSLGPDFEWYMLPLDFLYHLAPYPLNAWSSWNQLLSPELNIVRDWYTEPDPVDRKFVVLMDSTKRWTTQAAREEAAVQIRTVSRLSNRVIWFCPQEVQDVLRIVQFKQ